MKENLVKEFLEEDEMEKNKMEENIDEKEIKKEESIKQKEKSKNKAEKDSVKEKKESIKNEANKEDKDNKTDEEKSNKKQPKVDKKGSKKQPKFKKVEESPKKQQKEIEKMDKEKQPRKISKKLIISLIIIAIIALIMSTAFAFANINNEKIISGVKIQGIEVSGVSKEEAKAKLETIYTEKLSKNIDAKYQDYESDLNPTLMEVKYDIDKAVNDAYSLGRNSNIFVNNYNILFTLIGKKDINVDMTLNEEITKQTIQDIGVNLPGVMIDSGYTIEDDNLIITKGKEGICVNTDEMLKKVKENLNNINISNDYIEIPVETKKPQAIDIDKIHSEVYKEAKDAYYTKDPFTVYPEVEGVDFDVEAAKAMIAAEDKDEYIIKLTITKPKITLDQIGTEAFPDRLATFSTRYDASDRDRTTNLVLACQKINGKVILSGETFSYNATLGPRSAATGYKNAKVYENGQVVDGIGGGICQISSTLYNTALMSDMEIVERRNHQFVTSYVGAGRDATVVYGLTDFKFKNTRKYPVRIVASAKSGVATVSIYGLKEADREYTYSFSTKTISTIPFTTKYIEDSSLAAGKEVVTQKGANGIITQTYMTKMLNGKVISTELLSKDTYSAMQRIVRRGTVANNNTQTQPSTPQSTPPTTQTPSTPQDSTNQEPSTPVDNTDSEGNTSGENATSENNTLTN